jgi:hypothetical protein
LKFFTFSKKPIRSILATLTLGIAIGVGYEEMIGIGTWHKFQGVPLVKMHKLLIYR